MRLLPPTLLFLFALFLSLFTAVSLHAQTLYITRSASAGSVYQIDAAGTVGTKALSGAAMTQPLGIARDPAGFLFISDATTVKRVDPLGVVSTFASGFGNAYGLAIDASGNLYVANQSGSTISKVTPGGTVSTFATGISNPQGLAVDGAGNLFVTTSGGGQIVMVTPGGAVSNLVAMGGNNQGMAFDSAGDLFVTNTAGSVAKITFSSPGVFSAINTSWGNVGNGRGVVTVGTDVYVGSVSVNAVYKFDSAGTRTTFASGLTNVNFFMALLPEANPVVVQAGNPVADGGSAGFGNVLAGTTSDLQFTVLNSGILDLSGLAVTIDGADAADFSVLTAPAATVAVGGSTTFTIRYTATPGSKVAALHLASNASGALAAYDINLTASSLPDIALEQPANTALADGGTHDFGAVVTGGNTDLVFTVKNTGASDLTGLGITLDGANASEFSVFASPSVPVTPGGSTTFTVRFTPTSDGPKSAALHIASNVVGAKNPYDIDLTALARSATVISGTFAVGPTGDYASITAALADIAFKSQSGPVVLELQAAYVSTVESFPLRFGLYSQTTATNTLTLRPQTGATALSITSADATAATVDLNGAQFVTIDGRPGGAGSHAGSGVGTASQLTIENTSTSGVALRFINGASGNTIRYTTLRGVNNSGSATIVFGGTSGANGNSNNMIEHCDIREGATLPINGIHSAPSGQNNSNNTVSNCNLFNFYSTASSNGWGLRFENLNTGWTITGNSFYQTATRSAVASSVFGIGVFGGEGYTITNNSFGGTQPNAGGTAWTTTGTTALHRFVGIQLNVGTTTPSSVQGNTIANMVWTSGSNANQLPGLWSGIHVQAGSVNIGTTTGNTIGSGTGTGSIFVTTSGIGGTTFGIGSVSSGPVAIANNTIGSITTSGSGTTISASLIGIQVTAGANTISNNTVGSTTTANSLNAATSSTSAAGQRVTGIFSSSTASAIITGNTVANLNNNYAGIGTVGQIRGIVASAGVNSITGNTVRNLSTTSQNANTGMAANNGQSSVGIAAISTAAGQTVSQNTVHSLANTAAPAAVSVTGIYFSAGTSTGHVIARNFVHSLAVSSISASSQLTGMQFFTGSFTAQNNLVRVGLDASGSSTAGASSVRGIFDNGSTVGRNFYHNSVYLGGTQTTGSASSRAFDGTSGVSNTRTYQNNLFVNVRSNSGGTGKHYAVQYGGTTPNPTGLTAGGNIFLASGTGGVLGLYNSADQTTLSAWQAATGQDATSYNVDPLYVNPTGVAATVDLHLQLGSPADNAGLVIASVTDDFDGGTRSTNTPDIGADEFGISTSPVSGPICAGSALSVPFTVSAAFVAGNVFTAQLSNSAGSFASPVDIGTLSSTGSGTISASIPGATAAGTGYRIRVVGSVPALNGADNGTDIVVNAQPAWYADADGDGSGAGAPTFACTQPFTGAVTNDTDGCANDPLKQAPGACGCGVVDVAATYYADADGDGFGAGAAIPGFTCAPPANTVSNNTDGCENDPLKQAPGACGCGVADVPVIYYADTDGDGFGAGAAIPGFTCAPPANTVTNNSDDCPNTFGVVGGACDADPGPGNIAGTLNSTCSCTPNCTENVTIELRTDANSAQAGWEILDQNLNTVICSGGQPGSPYPNGITAPIAGTCCLPAGCFRLRVLDSGGDGFVTGGYQLRESGVNGRRIIDNLGNFNSGSVSALSSIHENGTFCVPIGDDKLIFSSCDKLDWVANKFIVASTNPAVSAQFGVTNTTSGYEFWFFDPNGTYSYRRFRSHATSDGFGTGATRACHFKVNGWINSVSTPHIPSNVLLNVRVRGRVAGNDMPFGPACQFKIDAALAACPSVKLQDDPTNTSDFSCGVFRNFGGGSNPNNRITAAPPQPIPAVASSNVRYQFRFRIPAENSCIVRPPQTSARLVLNWTTGTPLQCSKTYEVDVRVSLDGGATWCFGPAASSEAAACADTEAWGKVCLVTINPCALPNGGGSSMVVEGNNTFTMYPNPNRGDQLFLSVSNVEEGVYAVEVDIFDMAGKRVMARTIAVQDGLVNTNMELSRELAGGLYVVNITAGSKAYTERLVIQP